MLLSKPCISLLHLSTRGYSVPLRDSRGRMSGLWLQNPAVKFLFFFTKPADTADNDLDIEQQREANYLYQIYQGRIYCMGTVVPKTEAVLCKRINRIHNNVVIHCKYKAKCKLL